MNTEILLTQPSAYIALCVLAGVVVAGILYWADRDASAPYRLPLALLRGLAASILAFLLLGPLLRSIDTETQKPVILIAEDHSGSVANELPQVSSAFEQLSSKLNERYDVQRVSFGESIRPTTSDTTLDAATNISALFDYAADQYPAELLRGVVVATDGNFNQGSDPTYASAKITSPVYAVMLGDTTPTRDVGIRDVLYNQIAYLGDQVELQVDLQAQNMSGGASNVTVSAVDARGATRQLASETVTFDEERDFATLAFTVEPSLAGVQRYRVSASGPTDERNKANNSRDVYIDVLDARQRILLLAAAPHPDVSAIRQALDANKNYETTFELAARFDGDVSEFDLVIFHNLPAGTASIKPLLDKLDVRGVGRLFVAGPRTDITQLNNLQSLLAINPKGGAGNAVTPTLNGSFRLFTIPQDWSQAVGTFPPALAPFADYGELSAGDVLLTQRIGRVNTNFPLLAMGEVSGRKVGVLAAQDIWRWRLNEYQQTESHNVFDGMLLLTVQYLALREDKRPFRVTTFEKVYTTSEDVRLQGELYNASFQLVNDPDVGLRVTAADGTAYDFTMDKVGASYELRAGRLPAGSYSYNASTNYNGETYSASGAFTVREVQLESTASTADWNLLRRLAGQQGGRAITAAQVDALAADLLADEVARPVLYQRVRTRPLIDWPWLLAIVLGLLAIEWFVRRRLGTY